MSIPSPLGVNDTGTQNTPIDQVQNIEGVGKGELRSAREVRVLRQFYGDGYFGLGASHLPPIDTSVQATDEAYSRLETGYITIEDNLPIDTIAPLIEISSMNSNNSLVEK